MYSFNFKSESGVAASMEVPDDHTWVEMFEHFRRFLISSGYEVPEGEWVSGEDTNTTVEDCLQVQLRKKEEEIQALRQGLLLEKIGDLSAKEVNVIPLEGRDSIFYASKPDSTFILDVCPYSYAFNIIEVLNEDVESPV